jgi:hypothetical protein
MRSVAHVGLKRRRAAGSRGRATIALDLNQPWHGYAEKRAVMSLALLSTLNHTASFPTPASLPAWTSGFQLAKEKPPLNCLNQVKKMALIAKQ